MREKKKKPQAQKKKEVQAPVRAKKEKVGFIFECGLGGPDYVVAKHFLQELNEAIELVPIFLSNAETLLNDCGKFAAGLLLTCTRVIIMWDLIPVHERKKVACRHEDKERVFRSLDDAKADRRRVVLLCVERELECWLMADNRAISKVLGRYKPIYYVGKFPEFKNPDIQIKKPKTQLISFFESELGENRKYVDRVHALLLAQAITDWTRIRRSASFCRFAEKAAGVKLI